MIELRAAADRLGWTVVAEFVDHGISGAKGRDGRPQLDAMLKGVARKDFEMVASWSVDRLGRSTLDLLNFLEELNSVGIDLYLHKQGLNTSTPNGRLMFGLLGLFATFEREMIKERVTSGLNRAKANGTKSGKAIGRPTAPDAMVARIKELRAEGHGVLKIAKLAGSSSSVVQRVVAESAEAH